MSRPLRIEFPGAVYHVTSRGDRREPICCDDEDRVAQLEVIALAMDRFDAQVLAYCQMGNLPLGGAYPPGQPVAADDTLLAGSNRHVHVRNFGCLRVGHGLGNRNVPLHLRSRKKAIQYRPPLQVAINFIAACARGVWLTGLNCLRNGWICACQSDAEAP